MYFCCCVERCCCCGIIMKSRGRFPEFRQKWWKGLTPVCFRSHCAPQTIVCTFTVNVQQWHDQSIFTISNGKYIWFCKFLILSFMEKKLWNEDEKCWKLLMEGLIIRQRKTMSTQNWSFCGFYTFFWSFCVFSLL